MKCQQIHGMAEHKKNSWQSFYIPIQTHKQGHESSWEWLQGFHKINHLRTEPNPCYWGFTDYIKNNNLIINKN